MKDRETHVKEFVEENKEWLSKFFEALEPWNAKIISGNQLAWVRCIRIPLNAWNDDGLGKMMARF